MDAIIKLCDIPDEILHKVLSNLPIKEVVRTSVLSKKWLNRWMGMNIIDLELDEGALEKRQQFIDFVEKLLVVCNISSLKKFSLLFKVGKEAPRVNKWLNIFVNPMIEELNLDLENVKKTFVLPDQFFTSKKLIKLQLSVRQIIKFPSIIDFQNLVTLTLKRVIFPYNHMTSVFFYGLPSLKDLTLIDCDWKKVGTIPILLPSLQNLFIREWKDEDDDDDVHLNDHEEEEHVEESNNGDYDNFEVALQNINYHHSEIVFHANNLVTFSYDGDLINNYLLFFTFLATNATIEVHGQHNDTLNAGIFVFKLLKELFNVEKLSISGFALEAICKEPSLVANLPTFHHLVVLRVISSLPMNFCSHGLHAMLQNSPILEEIEFDVQRKQGVIIMAENGGDYINTLPTCFETHLKIIRIHGFCGNERELNAIKFLLQIAKVLDALYIHINEFDFDSPEGIEKLQMLYELIVKFPRASVDCVIHLE